MTWTPGRTNPLLIYPAPNLYNASFESALATADQNWAAGTAGISRVTTDYHTGGACLRVNSAGATTFAYQHLRLTDRAFKTATAEASCGNFYIYFWAKCKSCTPNAYLDIRFSWLDAGRAPLTAYVYTYWPLGASADVGSGPAIPTDDTWRFYRSVTAIPAIPSTAVFAEITLGRIGGAETFDAYIDDVSFGHALDGQDLGPYSYGAVAAHPYNYQKIVPSSFRRNQYGRHSAHRLNTGMYAGEITFQRFSAAGDTYFSSPYPWRHFIDYCGDGTAFSLQYDQSDMARDIFTKCALDQKGDGLTPVMGFTNQWDGTIKWRQVP